MKTQKFHTLVIGSGAAGLSAAIRLDQLGVQNIAIVTEGLHMGTSINTGSDKQTYYKLGMYGSEPDAPALMAHDIAAGGSMHGDLALVEAALSPQTFANLVTLGVPFPQDRFGQYVGYKTDHDPKSRATSCGPYTARDMCHAFIQEVRKRKIPVLSNCHLIALNVSHQTCHGGLFCDLSSTTPQESLFNINADEIIFATGGPGGLYDQSVYPIMHLGAIGVALAAGAKARNLPESQFGLASTKFRWNVSGSYMQVLPRFVSVDSQGLEREFLRDYFPDLATLYHAIFLKGYQWPFAAEHVPGSSLIDLFVYIETVQKKRRVFLDYRKDPKDFSFTELPNEVQSYLQKSAATGASPLLRLQSMNAPAIALYQQHHINLAAEPLEIAVCAQHNNGGLAGDIWWQSENIQHLYPIGEVNGTHGVTRPGGTALNAGQCGAFRAAEWIANASSKPVASQAPVSCPAFADYQSRLQQTPTLSWEKERAIFQKRMSAFGGFIREKTSVEKALQEAQQQLEKLQHQGLHFDHPKEFAESIRNEHLLFAECVYLSAILYQIKSGTGSRGGAIILNQAGTPIHPALDWKIQSEDKSFREQVLETHFQDNAITSCWKPCRSIPDTKNWFETAWKEYREGKIYQK